MSSRPDLKNTFVKDSIHNVTLPRRLDLAVMKPVQHQLAIALGDKDSSTDTVQMKQVSTLFVKKLVYQYALDCQSYFGSNLV